MGTQQFASGLSPIDTEIITSTRDNTQTLISRGNGLEKYKNAVYKSNALVSPGTYTLLSIAGEGYMESCLAKLMGGGALATYHGLEVFVDGSKIYSGAWQTYGMYTGFAMKDNFLVDVSGNLGLIDAKISTVAITGNVERIRGVVGPNNSFSSEGPVIKLSQPLFFKSSFEMKIYNNQTVTDDVYWSFGGAVKE